MIVYDTVGSGCGSGGLWGLVALSGPGRRRCRGCRAVSRCPGDLRHRHVLQRLSLGQSTRESIEDEAAAETVDEIAVVLVFEIEVLQPAELAAGRQPARRGFFGRLVLFQFRVPARKSHRQSDAEMSGKPECDEVQVQALRCVVAEQRVGREQALRHGVKNIDYRLGDMEEIPIGDGEVDLVFFSQSLHHALHPELALAEATRILAPGGRIVILDLVRHRFEQARELYADEWLGFSESDLESMLQNAGFINVEATVVDKEPETPQFQTLLATGDKKK